MTYIELNHSKKLQIRFINLVLYVMKYIYYLCLNKMKDNFMPPISPQRRKRVNTQDNIHIVKKTLLNQNSNLKKIRINTLPDEGDETRLYRNNSLKKLTTKTNLSPIKYYQTRLTLSSQAWSAYSIRQGIYKRGWRPNKIAQFNGLLRVIIAKIYLDIVASHPSIQDLMGRINYYMFAAEVKKQKTLIKDLSLKAKKLQEEKYFFADETIISIDDLIKGILISNNSELVYYSCIFMGYIVAKLNQNPFFFMESRDSIAIQSFSQAWLLINRFVDYTNQELRSRYKQTYITNSLQLYSTPNQLSIMFADLITTHRGMISTLETKQIQSRIRYKVGFNFYQNRTVRYVSDRNHPVNHVVLSCRGKNNFGVISYNKLTTHVIVLFDCKFSMAQIDINRIEQWLRSLAKPINESKGSKSRILPLLKLLQ